MHLGGHADHHHHRRSGIAGVSAMVSNKDELIAESVGIRDLGGFTGSYNAGLGGTGEGHDDRPHL